MLQKNQSRDTFKDLSMFLTGFYNDKAHAAYKSFQGQLSDLSPVVESDRKFMESVINQTLEDWIKTWSVDTLKEWYHDKIKEIPLNAELTHYVDAGFEGEPEVMAAIKLYLAYLNGKRENISPDGLFPLSIIVECKFVSILFANADRVFDVLERAEVFSPYGWKYSTWLVRMGTSIEVEISKLFPMLDLRDFKAQLGKRGREAIQQSNEENLENILKVLRPMVNDKSQSEIYFNRAKWQKDILIKHLGSVPDPKTIKRLKGRIEKRLSDDCGREIQIKVSKR
jgi:hypothetical protein